MKKILITIILLFATLQSLKAQGIQILDTPPDWTFMMSNLNTAQITSGILYNKVAMSTNLLDYNRGKYNLTHADHFMQGINELYYASGQTKFMSASQLKKFNFGKFVYSSSSSIYSNYSCTHRTIYSCHSRY